MTTESKRCHECSNPAVYIGTWPFNGQSYPYCQTCVDLYENEAQANDDHNARVVAQGGMDGGNCPRPSLVQIETTGTALAEGSTDLVYHPDPEINEEVIADMLEAEAYDMSVGDGPWWWQCPKCRASHNRGHHEAVGVHRCLGCGYTGTGGIMSADRSELEPVTETPEPGAGGAGDVCPDCKGLGGYPRCGTCLNQPTPAPGLTPRTDAEAFTADIGEFVPAAFARTLERELASSQAAVMAWENDSACLPEDQSITQTVTKLRGELAEARADSARLTEERDSFQRVGIQSEQTAAGLRKALEPLCDQLESQFSYHRDEEGQDVPADEITYHLAPIFEPLIRDAHKALTPAGGGEEKV